MICVICLDNICVGTTIQIELECGHSYHRRCIRRWTRTRSSCPSRRAELDGRVVNMLHSGVAERRLRRHRRQRGSSPEREAPIVEEICSSSSSEDLPSIAEIQMELNAINQQSPPPPRIVRTVPRQRISRLHIPRSAYPLGLVNCPRCNELINNVDDFFVFQCLHSYHVRCAGENFEPDNINPELLIRVHMCATCLLPTETDRDRFRRRRFETSPV